MLALALLFVLESTASADGSPYFDGDHATGDWGGARTALADHGVSVDAIATVEAFDDVTAQASYTLLAHGDLALTLDSKKLGLWDGTTLYALGQGSIGSGINDYVGSATSISNLEAPAYLQLTELFVQQSLFSDVLTLRLGKQDANRDFGTPRFGGNFINNNFGMYPTTPLPSYPTTGLGAVAIVAPSASLDVKAGLYQGNPQIGDVGIPSAFAADAGFTAALGVDLKHKWGARNGGTTSVGAWGADGAFAAVTGVPRVFHNDAGFFVQDEEHVYRDKSDDSNAGLTLILRFAQSLPDRTAIDRYVGGSLAWHGLFGRDDDTVGLGVGWFAVEPARAEFFAEAFYKARITKFVSLEPDAMFYRLGTGDAVLLGLRAKVKL